MQNPTTIAPAPNPPAYTLASVKSLKVSRKIVNASALPSLAKTVHKNKDGTSVTHDPAGDLRAAIKREGATEPLMVWAGMNIVVDGVERLRIYKALKLEEIPISLVELDSEQAAIEYRVRRNLARRHLNTWHKARAAYEWTKQFRRKRRNGEGDKRKEAARLFKVSEDSIKMARRILLDGPKYLSEDRFASELEALNIGQRSVNSMVYALVEASNFNNSEPTGMRGKKRKLPAKANKPNGKPISPGYDAKNKAKQKPLADLLNKVHKVDDFAQGLQWIEDESVDILVTSPPYHGAKYDYGHVYNPNASYEDCIDWLTNGFIELSRIMKPGAAICINIDDHSAHKSERSKYYAYPNVYETFNILRDICGLTYHRTIAWHKNVAPSRGGKAGGEFKPRMAGGGWESILIFSRGEIQRTTSADVAVTDLGTTEYLKWTNNSWTMPSENRAEIKEHHTCPFHEELPKRLIKLFTFPGAVVLDPFSGSGTTAAVAKQLGRDFIAFDKNADYVKASSERIKATERGDPAKSSIVV